MLKVFIAKLEQSTQLQLCVVMAGINNVLQIFGRGIMCHNHFLPSFFNSFKAAVEESHSIFLVPYDRAPTP